MLDLFKNLFTKPTDDQLKDVLNDGAFLVDVRSQAEFASGSVKGAVNIPLDTIPRELSRFKGKKAIVVFCRSGARSSMAKSTLEKNGFNNVINGGTWQNVSRLVA